MYRTPNIAPSATEEVLFAIEGLLIRALGRPRSETYTHHHLFPNLLIEFDRHAELVHRGDAARADTLPGFVRLFCYRDERANWLGGVSVAVGGC